LKIAVAGGAGLTGQVAVRDLLRNKKVEKVVVADFDSSSMDRLREKVGEAGDRLSFEKVDVKDHATTASHFAGCDVVINSVQYYFNLDVMAAALAAGVHYLDFGGLYHTTLEQMRQFGDKFREKGLLGIAGMGAQPGISNLMVKYALESLDTATSIEIFDGWRDLTKSDSPMYFTWSPQTFFDESSLEAIIFKNGKYETRPAFSEPQKVRFPSPVGSRRFSFAPLGACDDPQFICIVRREKSSVEGGWCGFLEDQIARRSGAHFKSKNFRRWDGHCSTQVFLEIAGIEEFGKDSRGCRTR
jgi:lysine 6-dehydrogenase